MAANDRQWHHGEAMPDVGATVPAGSRAVQGRLYVGDVDAGVTSASAVLRMRQRDERNAVGSLILRVSLGQSSRRVAAFSFAYAPNFGPMLVVQSRPGSKQRCSACRKCCLCQCGCRYSLEHAMRHTAVGRFLDIFQVRACFLPLLLPSKSSFGW